MNKRTSNFKRIILPMLREMLYHSNEAFKQAKTSRDDHKLMKHPRLAAMAKREMNKQDAKRKALKQLSKLVRSCP